MTKFVYLFKEGKADMRNLLGGKGAGLAEMTNLGLPVPPGFTITTEACNDYYKTNETISPEIVKQIEAALETVEKTVGKKLGDTKNPFLVSVRSGARASMPGMMDTILNLGLNDETVETMAKLTGNPRFAYDSYRRFIQMFSDVVMEIEKRKFEAILDEAKHKKGVQHDTGLDAADLKKVVEEYKKLYKKELKKDFPQNPREQLFESIKAVFRSWNNHRAIVYRRLNGIPGDWGTAVNVQSMVFGNMGDDSGTGVAFTRNPSTGENVLTGEYLMNAQGEDVVAGIRDPQPLETLKQANPKLYQEFLEVGHKLEAHYKDAQDLEFTIERGKLYMLQTRNAKRTAAAALKIAIDMNKEGIVTDKEAVLMVDPKQLDQLLHPQFDAKVLAKTKPIAKGLAASPGAATGYCVFTWQRAVEVAKKGKKVILVRLETSPEDIEGMYISQGFLTARGGMTSHAAVVARGWGKCCVAGSTELRINAEEKYFEVGGKRYTEESIISIDGGTGLVYGEEIPTVKIENTEGGDFGTLMGWADKYRALQVRTNADTPKDALAAIRFGAQGIGLTRTEHMFFAEDRIFAMRQMIVSKDEAGRRKALAKLLPMQKKDFAGIYEAMAGRPVTIRLLDPPLHEFLPSTDKDIKTLAEELKISVESLKGDIEALHEFNPMMGHRGCRLAVTFPEIAEMQTQAIIEAAIEVNKKGIKTVPEIMIPLISEYKEYTFLKEVVDRIAKRTMEEQNLQIEYMVGTMIEIPRACLTAGTIAEGAEFFSFGTNDLTQMTYGFSRDDAGKFLDDYYKKKVFEFDPFATIDQTGVGELMKITVERGRKTRPNIKLGICGEHGGEPKSVEFCHNIGLSYVSCSPFRVPIARLAAAQANIRNPRK